MRKLFVAFIVAAGSLAFASPAGADNSVCVGQLGRAAQGGMAEVSADWRSDFLGLDQPAGHYAAHIARLRMPDCPAPPQ